MNRRTIGKNETIHVIEYAGRYWGIQYQDGRETNWGYGPVENAHQVNPKYCKKPEDATWRGSHYATALRKGRIVKVCVYTEYRFE